MTKREHTKTLGTPVKSTKMGMPTVELPTGRQSAPTKLPENKPGGTMMGMPAVTLPETKSVPPAPPAAPVLNKPKGTLKGMPLVKDAQTPTHVPIIDNDDAEEIDLDEFIEQAFGAPDIDQDAETKVVKRDDEESEQIKLDEMGEGEGEARPISQNDLLIAPYVSDVDFPSKEEQPKDEKPAATVVLSEAKRDEDSVEIVLPGSTVLLPDGEKEVVQGKKEVAATVVLPSAEETKEDERNGLPVSTVVLQEAPTKKGAPSPVPEIPAPFETAYSVPPERHSRRSFGQVFMTAGFLVLLLAAGAVLYFPDGFSAEQQDKSPVQFASKMSAGVMALDLSHSYGVNPKNLHAELALIQPEPEETVVDESTESVAPEMTSNPLVDVVFPGTYRKDRWRYSTLNPYKLKDIVRDLQQCEGTIEVLGHSCGLGADEHNVEISQKRADLVRKVLIKKGRFDADRVIARGVGSSEPAHSNKSRRGRKANRRVTITCR